jgi:alkanesulfonate monooxygenase SsuD/methylene tetrahydromethanopterin reductase-like flavin-dependent oxidoreductase (luciferase family)
MQFGVQFFPIVGPGEKSAQDYFRESLTISEEADKLGYSHIRTVEHYFEPYGGYSPNPIVFLAAAAQRTTRARLVTGAVLPVFNHPLKLAGELAMLDAISGGRLDIGFARAFLPHEFRRFGISPDESQARYREGMEQIDLLLTTEHATHRGQFHSFENITSLPRPTQKPRPKFYVAATQTAETFEFAARNGYALMTIPIGQIKPLIALYRKIWRECGHPGDGEVMIAFHMFCHEDAKRARDIARGPLEKYFQMISRSTREWIERTEVSKDYRDYDKSMMKMKTSTLESQIESGSAWIGTPSEIRGIIARYIEDFGPFEHASLQVNFGMVDFAEAQKSLRLFALEVMPAFA